MITFTRTSPGTYARTTGTFTGAATTTITGSAIQVKGDPKRYAALELVLTEALTLFFTPTGYPLLANTDAFVQSGDSVVWNDQTLIVRDVDPIAPDGYVIAARIVVTV